MTACKHICLVAVFASLSVHLYFCFCYCTVKGSRGKKSIIILVLLFAQAPTQIVHKLFVLQHPHELIVVADRELGRHGCDVLAAVVGEVYCRAIMVRSRAKSLEMKFVFSPSILLPLLYHSFEHHKSRPTVINGDEAPEWQSFTKFMVWSRTKDVQTKPASFPPILAQFTSGLDQFKAMQ